MKLKSKILQTGNWFFDKLAQQATRFTGHAEVGVFGGKPHITDLKGGGKRSIVMADLAAIHEYGAPSRNIPERSFFRASLQLNRSKYGQYLFGQVKPMLLGKTSMAATWQFLGQEAQADVQTYMVNGKFVPLKPRTIKRKGSSKPLIDTGQLRQSVSYRVVK
ncbi:MULTISPECIES: hypothetical protein [unclassified Acinetobacter]|uniref:hypothetical protein n=1 Tax=unclassified Acinetobacter TaxID=196816 RepID=UPI00244BC844|nr:MULTISPECIES: hypothetical protein [unclassified Acinetobacter]MDH0032013.1 hypothetical protein [Acinetobacter sp. GD04021]MDH0887669.1 hypothetical protein [Acinetobacter sp. GD03873]MDH1084017.1 hypothetical protein [Acinetobacter sp. GD03983]MDH2191056.1 hypothetical protein [Acinetobacter sp. GD03645]MDH2204529.1 hypothetical protein [Acinetobacter sp. GD03647]